MKYIISIYIALGLVLSILFTIEYDCIGEELFPTYYGSPFVFKQKSLGSSMTYFYSVSGVIVNLIVWSVTLLLMHSIVTNVTKKIDRHKWIQIIYKTFVILCLCFSTIHIFIDSAMIGTGFGYGQNYWIFELDDEAEKWGVECKGEWILLK